MKNKKRGFALIINGKEFGLYKAVFPSIASKKIFKNLCREMKIDEFEFEIIDVIDKRRYKFFGRRIKLDENDPKNILVFSYYGEERRFIKKYSYKLERVFI